MTFLLFGGDVHLASWYLLQSTKSCQIDRIFAPWYHLLSFFSVYLWSSTPEIRPVGPLITSTCNFKYLLTKTLKKSFWSYFRSLPSQGTNIHKFIVFFRGPMKMQCQRIYWFVCEVFFEFCQTFAILWIEKPPRGEDWLKRYVSSSNKIVTIITFPVVHCCYTPQGETWISSCSNQGSSWWFFWQ